MLSVCRKFPLDCNILSFGAHYSPGHKPGTILKSAETTSRYVELLTSSQGRLFAYIYSLTGDPEQTHDALQVNGVYAPELKANSDEIRLKVESD